MIDYCCGRMVRFAVVSITVFLGACTLFSGGDETDSEDGASKAAREWQQICQAAVAGDAEAQKRVAEYYRYGYAPVHQDRVQAYLWYEHAERGLPPENLKRVETGMEMSLDELVEAKRQAVTWTPYSQTCSAKLLRDPPQRRPGQPAPPPRPRR